MVLTTRRSMKNYGLQRKMPVFLGPGDIFQEKKIMNSDDFAYIYIMIPPSFYYQKQQVTKL